MMTQIKNQKMLKIALLLFAIVCVVYGLLYLLFPKLLVDLSQGDPVNSGWLRWSGGILTALGIGSFMVSRKLQNQIIFITTMAMGTLFAGLALLYSWLTKEYSGATWFIALPTILVLALSIFLWLSRKQAT